MSQDHIVIPKSTLLQFAGNKNGAFHYLDLTNNKICTAFEKSYNTGENYYLPDKERYLSSQIETHMGRLRKLIDKLTEENVEIQLPKTIKVLCSYQHRK